jgi:redox-sensing transcriptional repressor
VAEDPRDPATPERPAPKAVIGRLSLYLRQLEAFERISQDTVSSSQLGAALGINDAQVRKDLATFGQFGYPGIGYRIEELTAALRHILGIDRVWPTALIGLGNLGRALLRYRGFRSRGFHIVALFDNDLRKIGQVHAGMTVRALEELPAAASALCLRLAILTVPADAAQNVADLAASAGIQGLLNFAPAPLVVPESVGVVAVDLSIQLEHLAYQVVNRRGGSGSIE